MDVAIADLKIGDIILCENKRGQNFIATIYDIIPSKDLNNIEDTDFIIDWYDDLAGEPLRINLPSFSTRVFRCNLINLYGDLHTK